MLTAMNRLAFIPVMTLTALACGCNTDKDLPAKLDLLAIGLEYHWFIDQNGRAPANETELANFKNTFTGPSPHDAARVPDALNSGKYVVIWNADVLDERSPQQERILAYEVDAPTQGGVVCFQNTLVERVTKEKFLAAMAKTKE
jgi:hypothetical protein